MTTDLEGAVPKTRSVPGWALAGAVALLAVMLGIALWRLAPPPPQPAGAPPEVFSAGRARTILADLAGDGAPHPVGSAAQERTRERVRAGLARLGLEVREETAFVCLDFGVCTSVHNLVAELPGREPGNAVLLAAHYDSVEAGPGVSDDLAGVAAVLEVARILKAGPPLRNSVLFLLDEGEEGGLLGARGFLQSSPEAARVKAVVNLEARGTSGPSLMFETGRDNRWLLPLFARSVPHPRTSSVFSTLYEYLPNDTDFSVFKRRGLSGFNFAYIGDPAHYHTPLDNLANASPASLQHHGENALGTVRALAGEDLGRPQPGQAVFFDLLGGQVLGWPASWGTILALLPLLLVVGAATRLWRRSLVTGGEIARGFLAWWAAVLVTAVAGIGLGMLLGATKGMRPLWPAHPLPGQAAFWLLALGLTLLAAGWFRRAGFFGLWLGGWLVWVLFGMITALLLPGASYLFIVPAWAAGLASLFLPGGSRARVVAVLAPALLAAAVWFPLLILFFDGLGRPALGLVAVLLAIVLTLLLPLGEAGGRRPLALGALAAALALAVAAAFLPAYTPDSPRRLNFIFHQDAGTGQARWVVASPMPLPPRVSAAVPFRSASALFPWVPKEVAGYAAPAPAQILPPPDLTVLRDEKGGGKRRLVLHLTSPRGATKTSLFIPRAARLETATIGGRPLALRDDDPSPFEMIQILGLPPGGIDLDLTLADTTPREWLLVDRSLGLPPAGSALLKSRPAWTAPAQDGDATLVSRKITL